MCLCDIIVCTKQVIVISSFLFLAVLILLFKVSAASGQSLCPDMLHLLICKPVTKKSCCHFMMPLKNCSDWKWLPRLFCHQELVSVEHFVASSNSQWHRLIAVFNRHCYIHHFLRSSVHWQTHFIILLMLQLKNCYLFTCLPFISTIWIICDLAEPSCYTAWNWCAHTFLKGQSVWLTPFTPVLMPGFNALHFSAWKLFR